MVADMAPQTPVSMVDGGDGGGVLSPRVYSILTCAPDGAGICQRLEEEVRRRAREEWLQSGNPDATHNWIEAERRLIRPQPKAPAPAGGVRGSMEKELPEAVLAELQRLREQVKALGAAQAEVPFKPHDREDPELRKFREGMTRMDSLKEELAATDKLLVERNAHFRQLEFTFGETQKQVRKQEEELAKQQAALTDANAGREDAERRCGEKDSEIKELTQKCSEQDALIAMLQCQLLEKEAEIRTQPRHPRRTASGQLKESKEGQAAKKEPGCNHPSWKPRHSPRAN